jgi:hypothetical protein
LHAISHIAPVKGRLSGQKKNVVDERPGFCFVRNRSHDLKTFCDQSRVPMILRYATIGFIGFASMAGCGARTQIVATNPALSLAPTCADAVPVYPGNAQVPYDYYEVALITTKGNSVYNGNGDLLKAIRNKAAGVGANGVIVDSLNATHATVRIIGAAVGASDADRKGRAIAIWMPSDTARVREACAGK